MPQKTSHAAETEAFRKSLKASGRVQKASVSGKPTKLKPGVTHVESADASGKKKLERRRFSAL